MSAREDILAKVRKATSELPKDIQLPTVEEIGAIRSRLAPDTNDLDTLSKCFGERWLAAHGILLEDGKAVLDFLQAEGVNGGYADPVAKELLGLENCEGLESDYPPEKVGDLEFGITMASLGIAETGTVALSDRSTTRRLAALAPWVHVAVLRKTDLKATLFDAISAFDADPSIVFVTGPSKTADIEGVMIEGVHGPGRQVCVLV